MVASAAVLFLALGIWRTNVSLNNAKNNLASQKLGPAEFIGIVAREPEIDEKYQKLVGKKRKVGGGKEKNIDQYGFISDL